MKSIDNKKVLDFACDLALKAGKLLLDYQLGVKKLEIIDKKEQGIATNADIDAEKLILSHIAENYPDHQILSEEYSYGQDVSKKWPLENYLWIVDPLDGTSNYFNGLGFYSVSIALASPDGIVIGVVYNPELDKLYFTSLEGSFVSYKGKTRKLDSHFNKDKKLSECIFSPFMGASKGLLTTNDYMNLVKIKQDCRAFRRLGSAALEIAMVASGELDAYWEKGLSPWDMAAAYAICENSDIVVTDLKGEQITPFSDSILAAPKKHHEYLTQVLTGQS